MDVLYQCDQVDNKPCPRVVMCCPFQYFLHPAQPCSPCPGVRVCPVMMLMLRVLMRR